jgi:hypothetical protein
MNVMKVAGPKLQTALLKYECDMNYTREQVTLLAGDEAARILEIGTPYGFSTATVVAMAALAGNTGNGAAALANPAIADGARPGIYQAICIEPAADAGTFEVFGPDGVSIGTATVGVAFTGEVKFTIADGGTNFIAGDAFKVTVPNDGVKAVAWDPDGDDGSQNIRGVAITKGYAPDGVDGAFVGLARGPAILLESGIEWPEGASTDDKAAARAVLAEMGIIVRAS